MNGLLPCSAGCQVLVAEVVHHYFPKLVELHNYSSANGFVQKMYNWNTLNQKVFKRLGFVISKSETETVANCVAGSVERILKLVKVKIAAYKEGGGDMDVGAKPTVAKKTSTTKVPSSQDSGGMSPQQYGGQYAGMPPQQYGGGGGMPPQAGMRGGMNGWCGPGFVGGQGTNDF
eukprot:gene11036-18639_t